MSRTRWEATVLVISLLVLQNCTAENCTAPVVGSNIITKCNDTSTGQICSLACAQGYTVVEPPPTIECTCDLLYATTTATTPMQTTNDPSPLPTTMVPPTDFPTSMGATSSIAMTTPMLQYNCEWNYTEINNETCVPEPTVMTTEKMQSKAPHFVTWKEYWISTGILIIAVVFLLAATIFLLCMQCRRNEPKPQPEVIPNSYARQTTTNRTMRPEFEDPDSDESDDNYLTPPPAATAQTTIPLAEIGMRGPQRPPRDTVVERAPLPTPRDSVPNENYPQPQIPPVTRNEPRHNKPAPLPKPAPSTMKQGTFGAPQFRLPDPNQTVTLRGNRPSQFSNSDLPPPPRDFEMRDRSPTVDSDDGYDNDPATTVPELPPPNPPPREPKRKEEGIYENEESSSYYEDPNALRDEGLYQDVEV